MEQDLAGAFTGAHWPDVAMALILVVGLPAYVALVRFPRLKRQVASGDSQARIRAYREGMAVQWALLAVGIAVWLQTNPPGTEARTLAQLGITFMGGLRWWIGMAAAALIMGVLYQQRRQVMSKHEDAVKVREQLQHIGPLLPHTRTELMGFKMISLTAGICEEILYRGFLIGIMAPTVGIWWAVALSTLFFGLGHMYQGAKGVAQTAIVGLVMAVLFVFTQSLWLPMLLHAFVDWNSGVITHHVLNNTAEPLPTEPA